MSVRWSGFRNSRIFFDFFTVLPESVNPTGEDVNDGEKICGKFRFGAAFRLAENQDLSTVETDQVLNEFKPESGKSVSTGNNNRELISAHKSLQYGSKPFPFVVET